jgi:hypothetical protein
VAPEVKYLIDSEEFKSIVGSDISKITNEWFRNTTSTPIPNEPGYKVVNTTPDQILILQEHYKGFFKTALEMTIFIDEIHQYIPDSEYRNKLSESSTVKLKVNQLDLDGNLVKIWDSISLAQKTLQIRHISEVCRGVNNHKTSGGYKWEYHN